MLLDIVTMLQDELAASKDFNSMLIVENKALEVIYLTVIRLCECVTSCVFAWSDLLSKVGLFPALHVWTTRSCL